jgi:hypothetical protein
VITMVHCLRATDHTPCTGRAAVRLRLEDPGGWRPPVPAQGSSSPSSACPFEWCGCSHDAVSLPSVDGCIVVRTVAASVPSAWPSSSLHSGRNFHPFVGGTSVISTECGPKISLDSSNQGGVCLPISTERLRSSTEDRLSFIPKDQVLFLAGVRCRDPAPCLRFT